MADFLVSIDTDGGPREPIPVTLVSGGIEVSLGGGGDASAANQVIANTRVGDLTETAPGTDTASSGLNGRLQRIAQRLTSLIALFPASLGAKTAAASLSVTPATDASFAARSAVGTKSAVASGVSSVTIVAANVNREGVAITNTDASILYLDLSGGTASATSYTASVAANGYYETPYGYTGLITGIWAADGIGSALVTEFV